MGLQGHYLPVVHTEPERHTPSNMGCYQCRIPSTLLQELLQSLFQSTKVYDPENTDAQLYSLPAEQNRVW